MLEKVKKVCGSGAAPGVGALLSECPTFRMSGHMKLAALCDALGLQSELQAAQRVFDLFGATWGSRTSREARWSDITDDSSPFEFSVAIEDGTPELRMLTEAQGDQPSLLSNWLAAWQLTAEIRRAHGVSLARAQCIADVFEPTKRTSVFSLWHAACFRHGRLPTFKLYFNPLARGEDKAEEVVEEAFSRLGQSGCFAWVKQYAMLRDSDDQLVYFSLDLGDFAEVRTKVYVAHRNATAYDVERVMQAVPGHVSGDALEFCDSVVHTLGPFARRPLLTCMAFVAGRAEPVTSTLHLPIRCYLPSDQVALENICMFLPPEDARTYERVVQAMASRPLHAGGGIQTYASFRRVDGCKRLTVYLSPEMYWGQDPLSHE